MRSYLLCIVILAYDSQRFYLPCPCSVVLLCIFPSVGMSFSLQSRDLIADSIETVMGGQWYDANIAIPGCDKNMPGCLIAMGRLNRPAIMVSHTLHYKRPEPFFFSFTSFSAGSVPCWGCRVGKIGKKKKMEHRWGKKWKCYFPKTSKMDKVDKHMENLDTFENDRLYWNST